jgi:hypothetical protein
MQGLTVVSFEVNLNNYICREGRKEPSQVLDGTDRPRRAGKVFEHRKRPGGAGLYIWRVFQRFRVIVTEVVN